jgi:hypothetical protein
MRSERECTASAIKALLLPIVPITNFSIDRITLITAPIIVIFLPIDGVSGHSAGELEFEAF